MRAAGKYEKSFEFQPVCKLWLSANRKPRVTDDSPAFWARVMLIPFTVSFAGRENRNLRPTLEHEPEHQAAILAWNVAAAVRYYQHGLEPPDAVLAATSDYKEECDPLAEFMAEACELDPPAEVGAGELFEHYRRWAERQGLTERERLTATGFGRLATARFAWDRRRDGKVYFGVSRRTL
jgi:putative DNA primase/helicase